MYATEWLNGMLGEWLRKAILYPQGRVVLQGDSCTVDKNHSVTQHNEPVDRHQVTQHNRT